LIRLIFAAFLLLVPNLAVACEDGNDCEVDNRTYQVKTPSDWKSRELLPVLLHFHGWGRSGTNVIRNKRIVNATEENRVLLIAPDGIGSSWSFWGNRRDDIDFAKAVIDDVARHWPIDHSQVFISGFSYGGAMAWLLACDSADEYAGLLGIAGKLTNISRHACKTGAFSVRQLHGKKDSVMRPPWDGDVNAWEAMLSLSSCDVEISRKSKISHYDRETWTQCDSDTTVALDIHNGGHWIPKGWIAAQLSDLLKP